MSNFINSAVKVDAKENFCYYDPPAGAYSFKNISPYLWMWSTYFQAVVSQVASYHFVKKFHDAECGIYKCEGGCRIQNMGDLVLYSKYCTFDGSDNSNLNNATKWCADLISYIIINWNPNDPKESMLKSASEIENTLTISRIRKQIDKSYCGGVFGGDALCRLFNHNPFDKFKIDRDYRRYCLIKFYKYTSAQVSQKFKDEDLGDSLLQEMKNARTKDKYTLPMLCCSPSRDKKGVRFWLNDGAYYGWHNEQQVREVIQKIKNGEKLVAPKP